MSRFKNIIIPSFAALGLFALIMDCKTAVAGAAEGVQLCIQTLIPSLFPFFLFSGYFCNVYSQINIPILKPVIRMCGLPQGAESLLVIGLLGGYPVGAKAIADAYFDGHIDRITANRMIGFCNNAGPAFIFGIIGSAFDNPIIPWFLLIIIIISSLLTGWILPQKSTKCIIHIKKQSLSFFQSFDSSLKATSFVCGWVILFRTLIMILKRWILWLLPESMQIIPIGFLELSNGCLGLRYIEDESLRFMLSSAFLSFGGLCVCFQTKSVIRTLSLGYYLQGKAIQTLICIILSGIIQGFIIDSTNVIPVAIITPYVLALLVCVIFIFKKQKKNNGSNFQTSVVQ